MEERCLGGFRGGEFEGRDGAVDEALGDGFEAVAALAQGLVEGEFAVGEEDVEGHVDDRDGGAHLVRDSLASDALAEDGEGERMGHFVRFWTRFARECCRSC